MCTPPVSAGASATQLPIPRDGGDPREHQPGRGAGQQDQAAARLRREFRYGCPRDGEPQHVRLFYLNHPTGEIGQLLGDGVGDLCRAVGRVCPDCELHGDGIGRDGDFDVAGQRFGGGVEP